MRQSELFTKTRREAPKDEEAKNAQLLIRGGFINKEMAGVYDYLPLGLRVLKKIENIIREEMNEIGGQEILMSSLQRPELWKTTDRWDDKKVDSWLKTKDEEYGLGFTHEEPITNMMEQFIPSYRDLPVYVYQFQTKFRNEKRAKSGVMRGREFLMKDLYSFSENASKHDTFYQKVKGAYEKIFNTVGIGERTYYTRASGGSFSKFSHEFQTLSDAGEDTIYINNVDQNLKIAVNQEIFDESEAFENLPPKSEFKPVKSIEVGNIFSLGTKFSEPLKSRFKNEKGEEENPIMGSYGIGLSRLMGTIVEVLSDGKGIVWPESVAPFDLHLVRLGESKEVREKTEEIYKKLSKTKEVLYDDRELRAGEKFADADLIGIPEQIIISERGLAAGTLEIKNRKTGETRETKIDGNL